MDFFFVSEAFAMGAPAGGQGDAGPMGMLMSIAPMLLIFAIFYFLMIRPQHKKQQEHKNYLQNLSRGDYVLTNGGIYGRITNINGDHIKLDVGEGMITTINRNFIAGPAESTDLKD